MEKEDPPPQYQYRFSGIPDDGIESLFDGEDCEVEDSFIVVPQIPSSRTRQENTHAFVPNIAPGPSCGNNQTVQENQVVPEEPQPPEPPVLQKKISFPIENGTVPCNFTNGFGDPGTDTFLSTMSSVSSNDSTSLELANSQILQLTEEKTKLVDLLRQRNEELKSSIVLYNELKLKIESSDADTKKKLSDAQKIIEHLKEDKAQLETQIQEIVHEEELTEQRLIELKTEQKSLLDSLTQRNSELKTQLDLKNAELLETKVTLLKLSEDKGEGDNLSFSKIEIDSLQAQLTSLLLEKEELTKILDDLKDLHEKDDKTRKALLEDATEQKELYREQMEAYRSSYEDERKDRLAMQEQKEKLEGELNHLKSVLSEKNAELENLHKKHLELANEHINRGAVGGAYADSNTSSMDPNQIPVSGEFVHVPYATPTPDEEIPKCPICDRKFSRRETLIAHADKCGLKPSNPFVFP